MDRKNTDEMFSDDSVVFIDGELGNGKEVLEFPETVSSYLNLLQHDTSVLKRFENFIKLVSGPLSTKYSEESLFESMMPSVNDLLCCIFKEISTSLSGDQEVTLIYLQEWLKMCIVIHEKLQYILNRLLKNDLDFHFFKGLPLHIAEMILITFQHCKGGNSLYNTYYDQLTEIVKLFKAAQDVHVNLLKLLTDCVNFKVFLEEELVVFVNVFDVLGEIGEVLVDVNTKSLVDNWKGYMVLTQNLSVILCRTSFDISKPLEFLSREIAKNLDIVLTMEASEEKAASQIIKKCKFFVVVALNLCDSLWRNLENISSGIVTFLTSIYNFYPPYLKYKNRGEGMIIDLVNSSIIVSCNALMDKLLREPVFFKVSANLKPTNGEPGFLFLLTVILQKIKRLSLISNVGALINLFFDDVKQRYLELFWTIDIPTDLSSHCLYEVCVVNLADIIVTLDNDQYDDVVVVLLKNVLQERVWGALLAMDVWCCLLSQKPPELTFATISQLLIKFEPLLKNNFIQRPEEVFLQRLLQRLYETLLKCHKDELIKKYPPSSETMHIWKVFGFKNFPKEKTFMIESFLINFIGKVEDLLEEKCSIDDFKFLCDGFEVISTLPQDNIDCTYLLTVLGKLWEFEIKNCLAFKLFLRKLLMTTNSFLFFFDDQQLLTVLKKIKQALPMDFLIKIAALDTLSSLARKSFKPSQEQSQIISEIFNMLLLDQNPIIKQTALEVLLSFLNATSNEEIILNALQNNLDLEKLLSYFIKRKCIDTRTLNLEDYLTCQNAIEFKHTCRGSRKAKADSDLFQERKKFKIDSEDVNVVMGRIKKDVEILHRLLDKENAVEGNCAEIVNLLCHQLNYKVLY